MALTTAEPEIIEHGSYCVVGNYAVCEGGDEPWGEAAAAFDRRRGDIQSRVDDTLLAFLHRPHRDEPSISKDVGACFTGVEVTDLNRVPEGGAIQRRPVRRYGL